MAYATQQDIVDKYSDDDLIVASDRDGDGVADGAVVTAALDDAGDEIDTYLAGRYTLPITPVPAILKPLCIDIALYKMSFGAALTEEKRTRYDDAIRLLTKIAEGKISLGPSTGGTVAPSSGGAAFSAKDRVWTRDTW